MILKIWLGSLAQGHQPCTTPRGISCPPVVTTFLRSIGSFRSPAGRCPLPRHVAAGAGAACVGAGVGAAVGAEAATAPRLQANATAARRGLIARRRTEKHRL